MGGAAGWRKSGPTAMQLGNSAAAVKAAAIAEKRLTDIFNMSLTYYIGRPCEFSRAGSPGRLFRVCCALAVIPLQQLVNIGRCSVICHSRPRNGAVAIVTAIPRTLDAVQPCLPTRQAPRCQRLLLLPRSPSSSPSIWSGVPATGCNRGSGRRSPPTPRGPARDPDSVDLSDSQLASVKVEPVAEREFPTEKQAVGNIGFNEESAVQVFTPYPGRIIALLAKVGDGVTKGQTLFTIASPDLLQAESTLISAAGVLEFTTRNLARLKELYTTRAVSQKELEQATSDHQ